MNTFLWKSKYSIIPTWFWGSLRKAVFWRSAVTSTVKPATHVSQPATSRHPTAGWVAEPTASSEGSKVTNTHAPVPSHSNYFIIFVRGFFAVGQLAIRKKNQFRIGQIRLGQVYFYFYGELSDSEKSQSRLLKIK